MAYAHNFWRITFGGPLFTTEEWSCNLTMGSPGGSTDGNPSGTELTAIRTAINTWFIHNNSVCNPQAKLAYVKANEVGTDGHFTSPFAVNEYYFPTPPSGGGTVPAAAQMSVCLSWMTARTRGPGAHGRIYPPSGWTTVDATGLITVTAAEYMRLNAKTMLDSLNDVKAGVQCVIATQGGQAGAPAHVPITHVRVGRLYDRQVRRRNELLENYVSPLALEAV